MKRFALIVLAAAVCAAGVPLLAQQPGMGRGGMGGMGGGAAAQTTLAQPRTSPHDTVSGRIGGGRNAALIVVYYGRPYSKDPNTGAVRKIWGGLVPFGQVWRMGSDEATVITTPVDLQIGDTVIPAGAYSLDMQPEADGSAKLIFNKQVSRWGIPYTAALQKDELVRVDMKKADAPKPLDEFVITLAPNATGDALTLTAAWENTQYSVDLKQAPKK